MSSTGNKPPESVLVKLTQGERDLLLKICDKYRHKIPTYLKSRQWEIGMLEEIIDKLS